LGRDVRSSLNGPVDEKDEAHLKDAIKPWVLPHALLASLQIHDGEWSRGCGKGMVMGARLLTAREIVEGMLRWRGGAVAKMGIIGPANDNDSADPAWVSGTLKIPLFSETGARQIAMELSSRIGDNNNHHNNGRMYGRVVVVSPLAPYAVHYRVEASCWERFLTLI